MRWQALAACQGRPDDWLAEQVGRARVAAAVEACQACPVLQHCRAWVLDPATWQGVDPCPWHVVAAMTPAERDAARWRPRSLAVAHG
jgi:hypothetical protein